MNPDEKVPLGGLFLSSFTLYTITWVTLLVLSEIVPAISLAAWLIGLAYSLLPALLTVTVVRLWNLPSLPAFLLAGAATPWFLAGLSEALWDGAPYYSEALLRSLILSSLAFGVAGAVNWFIWNWQGLIGSDS